MKKTPMINSISGEQIKLEEILPIATNIREGLITFDTLRAIRTVYPQVHISCGLSNISFGLPVRALINRTFLVLALEAGMDTAIVDPTDRDLKESMLSADLLLGKDKHCLGYFDYIALVC